jgi:proteasome lid subunit RPN8/RPN11
MQILLPEKITQRLSVALEAAGRREIGGILMGERVSDRVYRVQNLTVQRRGGTFASFVRGIQGILTPLKQFFRQTDYNYTRFNYLGEWHSHPSFALEPSPLDRETMWDIVEDPQVGANFAVMIIVRLDSIGRLQATATVYLPGRRMLEGELIQEGAII